MPSLFKTLWDASMGYFAFPAVALCSCSIFSVYDLPGEQSPSPDSGTDAVSTDGGSLDASNAETGEDGGGIDASSGTAWIRFGNFVADFSTNTYSIHLAGEEEPLFSLVPTQSGASVTPYRPLETSGENLQLDLLESDSTFPIASLSSKALEPGQRYLLGSMGQGFGGTYGGTQLILVKEGFTPPADGNVVLRYVATNLSSDQVISRLGGDGNVTFASVAIGSAAPAAGVPVPVATDRLVVRFPAAYRPDPLPVDTSVSFTMPPSTFAPGGEYFVVFGGTSHLFVIPAAGSVDDPGPVTVLSPDPVLRFLQTIPDAPETVDAFLDGAKVGGGIPYAGAIAQGSQYIYLSYATVPVTSDPLTLSLTSSTVGAGVGEPFLSNLPAGPFASAGDYLFILAGELGSSDSTRRPRFVAWAPPSGTPTEPRHRFLQAIQNTPPEGLDFGYQSSDFVPIVSAAGFLEESPSEGMVMPSPPDPDSVKYAIRSAGSESFSLQLDGTTPAAFLIVFGDWNNSIYLANGDQGSTAQIFRFAH